ncbi:MAG: hypothetical protein ACJAVK_002918, partial [Akkermansiaceae bacterium]
ERKRTIRMRMEACLYRVERGMTRNLRGRGNFFE